MVSDLACLSRTEEDGKVSQTVRIQGAEEWVPRGLKTMFPQDKKRHNSTEVVESNMYCSVQTCNIRS